MHSWHYVHKTLGCWRSYWWAGKWILLSPPPPPIWTSSVATHLNLRRHLLAIRISSKIKCLIRYDFSTFTWGLEYFDHKQWSIFSKPSSGKKTAAIFSHYFLTCDQAFFFSGTGIKMKYQASFSPSLQTKREEGPPDRRLTIFTILNNLKLVSFWMASRITNSTIFHIKRTLKVIIETLHFSWNR